MNQKLKVTLMNIAYAFSANGVSAIISAVVTLVVPKLLGITEYSYWQLYIFYTTYVGFFHLGWIDGIYLKYGGKDYSALDYPKFVTQYLLINVFEISIALFVSIGSIVSISNADKKLILLATCLCAVITISKTYFLYIFELTNRIKEYARYTKIDRYIFFVVTMILLFLGVRDYRILLLVDIIARVISLFMCMKAAKEVAFGKLVGFKDGLKEALDNIFVGSKLMIANVASLLIVGIVRFGIERRWDIETFGKVSLTLSISNFLLTMINAVGVVMFPMLRRTSRDKLSSMYSVMRTFLMIPLLSILFFYSPLKILLEIWLPKYTDSLRYVVLLLPICIFECKMSLLINTYLKTLRKEKWILMANIFTVILSILTTGITVFVFSNLTLAVLSIVILLAFRCILAETLLSVYLKINISKDIIIEIIMVTVFMISSWMLENIISIVIYAIAYLVYIIVKKNDIKRTISIIRPLLFSRNL